MIQKFSSYFGQYRCMIDRIRYSARSRHHAIPLMFKIERDTPGPQTSLLHSFREYLSDAGEFSDEHGTIVMPRPDAVLTSHRLTLTTILANGAAIKTARLAPDPARKSFTKRRRALIENHSQHKEGTLLSLNACSALGISRSLISSLTIDIASNNWWIFLQPCYHAARS
jgi:hypothetical protein